MRCCGTDADNDESRMMNAQMTNIEMETVTFIMRTHDSNRQDASRGWPSSFGLCHSFDNQYSPFGILG